MTSFEYLQRVVVDATLEVEDIGNCVILGRNDMGEEYYFMTKSTMGQVEVIEYGPCIPDLDILPHSVALLYDRFDFSSGKLEKRIDRFLNNPKRMLTQAETVDIEVVRNSIPDLIDKVFPER